MPVIDLDSPLRGASGRATRRAPRFLIVLAAGVLLFGVSGEPGDSGKSFDETTFCAHFWTPGEEGGASASALVLDVGTGRVLKTVNCPANSIR